MTLEEIRRLHPLFFQPEAMRFFDSRIHSQVYVGCGGVFFVTSEQFVSSKGERPFLREFNVRRVLNGPGGISTVRTHHTRGRAHRDARAFAALEKSP